MQRRISNEDEFKAYIQRRLGSEGVSIQITEDNLLDCMYDALELVNRYAYNEGVFKAFIPVTLKQGDSRYDLSEFGVQNVSKLHTANMGFFGGANSVESTAIYQSLIPFNMYMPMSSSGMTGTHLDSLSDFMLSYASIKETMKFMKKEYKIRYNKNTCMLDVIPSVKVNTRGILECYVNERIENLYNNRFYKELTVALSMQSWASNINKYIDMGIAGGGKVDHERILKDGKELEEKIMDQMDKESQIGMFKGS